MLALAGAGRAGGGACLARLADLGLGARRDAAGLRVRPALPGPGADPRPRPAADRPPLRRLLSGPSGAWSRFSPHSGTKDATAPVGAALALGAGMGGARARRGRRRLPDPAPLPAEPLRESDASPRPASMPPSPGPATSPAPASPPPAPASTRSSAPTSPTASSYIGSRTPPRRLRGTQQLPRLARSRSTKATTTTSSPPATASNPATPVPAPGAWTEGPGAEVVLSKPPTVVFRLTGPLDPRPARLELLRRGRREAPSVLAGRLRDRPRRRLPSHTPRLAHGPDPQLLDHRPHRPRQVDAGRPHPRAHRRRRPDENAGADARLDGPRARARDHDQGPGRAGRVHRRRRPDLPPAPDRHARPRRLLLRGLAQPRRLRGRAAGRRRRPGGRGADRRQHLPGDRERAGADPGDQQGRPARRRAGAGRRGDRRPDRRRPRGSALDLGQDRRGRARGAGGDRRADPGAQGRARRAAAGADLRLRVRPVPRRDRLRADGRRRASARASGSWRCRTGPRPTSTTSASSGRR